MWPGEAAALGSLSLQWCAVTKPGDPVLFDADAAILTGPHPVMMAFDHVYPVGRCAETMDANHCATVESAFDTLTV